MEFPHLSIHLQYNHVPKIEFLLLCIRLHNNQALKIDVVPLCSRLHYNHAIWCNTSLTPHSTVVPWKLIVAQFVIFRSCCENQIFMAFFTAAGLQFWLRGRCSLPNIHCPVLPSQMQPVQYTLSSPTRSDVACPIYIVQSYPLLILLTVPVPPTYSYSNCWDFRSQLSSPVQDTYAAAATVRKSV